MGDLPKWNSGNPPLQILAFEYAFNCGEFPVKNYPDFYHAHQYLG